MSKKNLPVVVNGVTLDTAKAQDRVTLAELKAAAIRLRNFGASISSIGDKLGLSEDDAERVLSEGLREVLQDDADAVRARQQATLNDIRRAMYPAMAAGDQGAAGTLINVLKHESEIHGIKGPQRIQIGVDQETFTTRVQEDIREIGLDPTMDTPLTDEEDDGWANT